MNENKEALDEFLHSKDFMKLGRAATAKNWSVAMMTLKRMEKTATELGLEDMKRNLSQVKQGILTKNVTLCQNGLALIVAKRVRLMKMRQSETDNKDIE